MSLLDDHSSHIRRWSDRKKVKETSNIYLYLCTLCNSIFFSSRISSNRIRRHLYTVSDHAVLAVVCGTRTPQREREREQTLSSSLPDLLHSFERELKKKKLFTGHPHRESSFAERKEEEESIMLLRIESSGRI